MLKKLEGYLLNVFLGKVLARVAITIVGFIATGPVQGILSAAGATVAIDQATLTTGMIGAAHAAFEWFKARRMKNPNSPAIQTDAKAPGADVSAAVNLPK